MRDGYENPPPHVEPSTGVLEAYDAGGVLLETVTAPLLSFSTFQTLSITRATADIAFIRAYGTGLEFEASAEISLLTFDLTTLSGWIFMPPDVPDIGYSLDEGDLLYFLASGTVWNLNLATGQWNTVGPEGLVYANWPFIYELDPGHLWFALPPESGLWVYHFSNGQWVILPQIIPW